MQVFARVCRTRGSVASTAMGPRHVRPTEQGATRPLLLGMGWFPDQPGGLNRYLRSLHEALERLGEAPSAVVFGPAGDAPPSVRVAGPHEMLLPLRLARFAVQAVRACRTAELVDAHFALYAVLPGLAPPLRRLPLVVHFQGPWSAESEAVGQKGAALAVKHVVETAVYRRAELLITLSAAFKQLLVTSYGVAPWLVRVLPPGVDLGHFRLGDRGGARRRLDLPQDAWVAVTVRRLVPRTGVEGLLQAWPSVLEAEPAALLLVTGDGPERVPLETEMRRLGLDSSVRFLGAVDDHALIDCYQAADVSVVPSTSLEGFGLVVLESLACGTPAIVTDAGGLGDLPFRLDPSTVVPAGDPCELGRRLRRAADGTQPLPDSSACRSIAEDLGWDHVARSHAGLYRDLLRGGHRRLRVVYLDHVAELSGGELALARLLPALTEVDAHVILAQDGPLVARLEASGISVEVLPLAEHVRGLRRARVRPGDIPVSGAVAVASYVARLSWRLRGLRPDLVHTYSLKAGIYGGLAARLARLPVIWHMHDRIATDYLPGFAVGLVRTLVGRVPQAVVANSRATLATIPDVPGRPKVRAVVASPVPVSTRDKRPSAGGSGVFKVGMVGRLMPWKGQHVFLEAFARAFPDGEARAIVVGGPLFGEEDYERSLREQAQELGLGQRVEFRGHVDDVAAELAGFDVLVHASVVPEPFGLAVAEGMAAGLAVVATAAGGPSEIITDGVDGLLVPAADVAAFAGAMRRLAADPELRDKLGRAARRRVDRFRPEVVAQETMAVYRKVVELPEGGIPAAMEPRDRSRC